MPADGEQSTSTLLPVEVIDIAINEGRTHHAPRPSFLVWASKHAL
jgi:hypothetical protein